MARKAGDDGEGDDLDEARGEERVRVEPRRAEGEGVADDGRHGWKGFCQLPAGKSFLKRLKLAVSKKLF